MFLQLRRSSNYGASPATVLLQLRCFSSCGVCPAAVFVQLRCLSAPCSGAHRGGEGCERMEDARVGAAAAQRRSVGFAVHQVAYVYAERQTWQRREIPHTTVLPCSLACHNRGFGGASARACHPQQEGEPAGRSSRTGVHSRLCVHGSAAPESKAKPGADGRRTWEADGVRGRARHRCAAMNASQPAECRGCSGSAAVCR